MAATAEASPTAGAADEAVLPKHYVFLCFLTLLNVLNFVDRQLLASFANFIKPDLNLTNTEFGLLTGFAFIIFYATMGLFAGALADMLHRPRLIAGGLTLWSALTAASGLATNFITLAIPRVFIGIGESVLTPTSMSLLADRFPASRLGFASGFYYMGVPIGAGVSLLIAGYLGPAIGWRNCFYILGAIGLALAVFTLFVKETPRRRISLPATPANSTTSSTASSTANKPSLGELIRTLTATLRQSPALLLTISGGVAFHFVLGAATFDQIWYVEERGFERAYIAQVTGWIGMAGGILGNLFGGVGGDWFLRKTRMGRPMFLFWIMVVMAPINIAYRIVPPESLWFWIGVFAGYFQLGCFYGPTFSTVQELAPPQVRGTIVAFYILTLNLIGLGIGITAGGIALDAMINAGYASPYSTTLLIFTVLSLAAIPLFWFAGRRFEADRTRLLAAT